MASELMCERAADLVTRLKLQAHPEGGFYREVFRSSDNVMTSDGRGMRSALTTIDFLLPRGQFSAWHRVASDEVWHLLEGGPLRLWLVPPSLDRIDLVDLGVVGDDVTPRHVVPAGWWQAALPLGQYAYVGATVGPGFEFADFAFARGNEAADHIARLHPGAAALL